MAITLSLVVVLLLVGIPIAMAFALAGLYFGWSINVPMLALGVVPYETIGNFTMIAIPLYMLMGELMKSGDLARQLMTAVHSAVRFLKHSFGYVTICTCAVMGAITGSSVATVAAIGAIVRDPMLERGYPAGYVGALVASAGLLGVLLPPSIPLIIYGSTVGVSVSDLFLGSLFPGLLTVLLFCIVHFFLAPRVLPGGEEVEGAARIQTTTRSLFSSLPALIMPVIVLGGIYGGVFTPTEAAAIGTAYALAYCIIVRRPGLSKLHVPIFAAAISSGAILAIMAFASIFNRVLILDGLPITIAQWSLSVTDNPLLFLLAVNLVLIVVGTFMETNASVLLMGPLLAPAATRYGIDPIQFGVMLVVNLEIGLLTPPLAANLFVAAKAVGCSSFALMRHLLPFFIASLVMLAVITFFPPLTTWVHGV